MEPSRAETYTDFLQCLEMDTSLHIMSFLDDPVDLVRASAVSRFWYQFVIANRLAKQLCLKKFLVLSNIDGIVDKSKSTIASFEDGSLNAMEWELLEREQKVYASLLQALTKSKVSPKDCIRNALSASSTDNYPGESIVNTLNARDSFTRRPSYWSSKGQSNPNVPETLIYKLRGGIWVITEIDIRPFEAFFQEDNPIYSAKYVRFRFGHPKSRREIENNLQLPFEKPTDDQFVWTYTSQEFPMMQENSLQPFKLPEPVLCIDGYLQIELLGRVQRQEIDGLFYFCVCYVRAFGRPLYPAFHTEILEPYGKLVLKYHPDNINSLLIISSSDEISQLRYLEEEIKWDRMSLLEDYLHLMQQVHNNPFDVDEDEDEVLVL